MWPYLSEANNSKKIILFAFRTLYAQFYPRKYRQKTNQKLNALDKTPPESLSTSSLLLPAAFSFFNFFCSLLTSSIFLLMLWWSFLNSLECCFSRLPRLLFISSLLLRSKPFTPLHRPLEYTFIHSPTPTAIFIYLFFIFNQFIYLFKFKGYGCESGMPLFLNEGH